MFKTSALSLVIALSASSAFAAALASDTAANYTSGWNASTTPNLGTGFGAWTVTANNNQPPYVGTFLDSGSGGDTVLSGGYAWGTYANSGDGSGSLVATRAFNTGAGSASLVNQTFSIGVSSGGVGGAGQSVALLVGSAFNLAYVGGVSDNFVLSVDGAPASIVPVNFASFAAGVDIALSVTGGINSPTEGYNLSISPFAGGSALYSASGTFDSSTYNTSSFQFQDNNTGGNEYFNNPTITATPEPSTLSLIALSGGALAFFRRRQ